MTGQLLQFGGSLLAILFIGWLVHRMGLGGDRRIRDEAHARELAAEIEDGFAAREVALDGEGRSALLCDEEGRVMALRMHGAKAAGRLLGPDTTSRILEERGNYMLEVHPGERFFGTVALEMDEAAVRRWHERLAGMSR